MMESLTPSTFYELSLNIRGHKDIHECLEEYFSVRCVFSLRLEKTMLVEDGDIFLFVTEKLDSVCIGMTFFTSNPL